MPAHNGSSVCLRHQAHPCPAVHAKECYPASRERGLHCNQLLLAYAKGSAQGVGLLAHATRTAWPSDVTVARPSFMTPAHHVMAFDCSGTIHQTSTIRVQGRPRKGSNLKIRSASCETGVLPSPLPTTSSNSMQWQSLKVSVCPAGSGRIRKAGQYLKGVCELAISSDGRIV